MHFWHLSENPVGRIMNDTSPEIAAMVPHDGQDRRGTLSHGHPHALKFSEHAHSK
jgi:hypothetical protein